MYFLYLLADALHGFCHSTEYHDKYLPVPFSNLSEGYMYWSDVRNGSLSRAFFDGTNVEVLLRTEDNVIGKVSVCLFVYLN